MKNFNHLFILIAIAIISFSSCTKCTVCTHPDLTTGEEVVDEFCAEGLSSGRLVSDYEAGWQEDWGIYGGYCRRY